MFGYANMKFSGGIANGQTIYVDVLPIVLITVYRPIPASLNKEWAWMYATYFRKARGYYFGGYRTKEEIDVILLETGIREWEIHIVNP